MRGIRIFKCYLCKEEQKSTDLSINRKTQIMLWCKSCKKSTMHHKANKIGNGVGR